MLQTGTEGHGWAGGRAAGATSRHAGRQRAVRSATRAGGGSRGGKHTPGSRATEELAPLQRWQAAVAAVSAGKARCPDLVVMCSSPIRLRLRGPHHRLRLRAPLFISIDHHVIPHRNLMSHRRRFLSHFIGTRCVPATWWSRPCARSLSPQECVVLPSSPWAVEVVFEVVASWACRVPRR